MSVYIFVLLNWGGGPGTVGKLGSIVHTTLKNYHYKNY